MKRSLLIFAIISLSLTLIFALSSCKKECEHAFQQETVKPNCIEDGEDKFACTKCDYYYTVATKSLGGHTPGDAVKENITDATCTTDGYYDSVISCTVCDTEISRNRHTINITHEFDYIGVCSVCECPDLNYEFDDETLSYKVRGMGNFKGRNLVIPSTYKGLPVTGITGLAFYGCTSLTSITIPNSVTSIGNLAFQHCSSLSNVTIPSGVTNIGYRAFEGCTSLVSITIPNSVISIGDYAFYNCTSLASVTIPNSVTSIGYQAFYNCKNLASVTIGNSVTSIGDFAFNGCTSLASVTIGNSVTSIGDFAFEGCTSLVSITIPNSVTSISAYTFEGCTSLASVTIGNGVTSIGYSAFFGCTSLTTINYRGTQSEWNAISGVYSYTDEYTIIYNYTGE